MAGADHVDARFLRGPGFIDVVNKHDAQLPFSFGLQKIVNGQFFPAHVLVPRGARKV